MLENCYSWGQWLPFCKEINFFTKYRIESHVICELSRLCYWNTRVNFLVIWCLSSETQGQSVGSGESARQKFSGKGERAPRYWLSPNYFQKFMRMPAPDWAQKNALYYCAQSANSFSWVLFVSSYTTAIREIKIHVYRKRQTSDSSWEFLRLENKKIKTVPNDSYG